MNGIATSMPIPHMIGSMAGLRTRSSCANVVPPPVPRKPVTQVIAPKMNATLFETRRKLRYYL